MSRSDTGYTRRACLKALCALPLLHYASDASAAGVPVRVVSLSWAGAQMLVSLGIAPLALTELADYPRIGALPPMPAGTIELGAHSEPNLELLQQLKPDLIVIDTNQQHLDARLRTIAPTFTIDIYNPQRGKPYARAVDETLRLGALLGHAEAAQRYLREVDRTLADRARTLSTLKHMPPVLLVDLYDDGRHLYLYGPNSMMQDVMDRLGVRNAWPGSTDSGYLLEGIEALAAYGDAQMLYISHGARDRVALHNLDRSVLWQHLPFVQAQRVRPLPGFFAYGSTASAVQFARELTAGLVALDTQAERTHG
ncbi:ABC transporter substrate-binding protein [Paraburkholderia sp. C35]|uniref:ABC transporter substrate-binding protein n=1 Tax=Paraburkholderia sp. C35 TaxID=2126993 RepID=UPI0013A547A3|nr:ABC transporter substrate-binding protein [Paraburkholderia sp. C35]